MRVVHSDCPMTRYPSGVIDVSVIVLVPGLLGRMETTSKARGLAGVVAETIGAAFCAKASGIAAKSVSKVALCLDLRIGSASFTRGILRCRRVELPASCIFGNFDYQLTQTARSTFPAQTWPGLMGSTWTAGFPHGTRIPCVLPGFDG